MDKRIYLISGILGLSIALIIALLQHSPGYMDADYYYAGGLRLAEGYGFSEVLLWNFLDDPSGLPHPSHGYWMPLVSVLAAGGMVLLGNLDFQAARILFVPIAGLIPALTAFLAWRLAHQKYLAILAGAFAILSGFYLPYMATTDIFALYMLLGVLFFLAVPVPENSINPNTQHVWLNFAGLGLIAGLMHLSRADGLIWLLVALAACIIYAHKLGRTDQRSPFIVFLLVCLGGYLLVMLPWYARNLSEFGTFLSPGGGRALWILEYDELFSFPASQLTMQRWWQSGIGEILRVRWWAAGQNLLSWVAVQGEVFLLPLILIGMWKLRLDMRIQLATLAWTLTFAMMTLPFPFQGVRGGFFHSGSALQPIFWAAAPVGLDYLIGLGARLRDWRVDTARLVLGSGLVIIAAVFTAFITYNRIFMAGPQKAGWDVSHTRYQGLEEYLLQKGVRANEIVMVNNSPGYFAASGRPAISIPFGDVQTICTAGGEFRARYLLLEIDQIQEAGELFDQPSDRACLKYVGTHEGVRVYEIFGQ